MKLDSTCVCIVTGGASGLGLATVRAFLGLGCKVVIADFNETAGKKLVEESGSNSLKFFKTDVSNEENVIKLIKYTVECFGSVHIVVNSAGVISAGLTATPKGVLSSEEMLRVLKINVIGTLNVSKHAAAQMLTQPTIGEFVERGVIINVASLAGLEGQRGQVVYAASKGAVIGMALPMARDLGKQGIRVATVAPGVFETPMGDAVNPKIVEILKKSTALDRIGHPKEFADCIVGLCVNSYFTGSVIRLDGGSRLPHL